MIHFSLFSGIGGFEIAAEAMGWKNLLSCDVNEFGNKVREYYWPNAYHHKDVKSLNYDTIQNELSQRFGKDWRSEDVILTGGFPCQPYSNAGKKLGTEDDRHLWPEMLRIIGEVQPRWVVGENVGGLISWGRGLVFDQVQTDLEAKGYEILPFLLPACAVNAPHRRDRIWFIAYRPNPGVESLRGGEIEPDRFNNVTNAHDVRRDNRGNNREKRHFQGNVGITKEDKPERDGRERGTCEAGSINAGTNTDANGTPTKYKIQTGGDLLTGENGGTIADTQGERGKRVEFGKQPETCGTQQVKFGGSNSQNITADADSLRGDETNGIGNRKPNEPNKNYSPTYWANFPTQSPICSGNDGISNRLDGITFSTWRKESVKAYGNAVVPALVLEIFKAIDKMNKIEP